MKNERVIELYYQLGTIKTVDFKSPPPVEGETTSFNYLLSNGKLTIRLKQYCSSVEEAHNLVDNFIRSWELDDAIRNGRRRIKFDLYDAKIIDLHNPNAIIIFTKGLSLKLGGSAEIKFIEPCYPPPPYLFKISADVLTLWQRYEGYIENHEPLQSMAYFCLTFLLSNSGTPKKGQKKLQLVEEIFKIEFGVLKKLSELTSIKGDLKTGRKFGSSTIPLTAAESEWIIAAVRAIISRVGEINSNPSLSIITMNDLPKL
jgi:hypothetical protein